MCLLEQWLPLVLCGERRDGGSADLGTCIFEHV